MNEQECCAGGACLQSEEVSAEAKRNAELSQCVEDVKQIAEALTNIKALLDDKVKHIDGLTNAFIKLGDSNSINATSIDAIIIVLKEKLGPEYATAIQDQFTAELEKRKKAYAEKMAAHVAAVEKEVNAVESDTPDEATAKADQVNAEMRSEKSESENL